MKVRGVSKVPIVNGTLTGNHNRMPASPRLRTDYCTLYDV